MGTFRSVILLASNMSAGFAMASLDHMTLIAPSIERGIEVFESLTGVHATEGGKHSVNGTANALASLGDQRYLEIMCPDPDGPPAGSLGAQIATVGAPRFVNYLVRSYNVDAVGVAAERFGLRIDPDFVMSRETLEGQTLQWRIGVVAGHDFGPIVPHFIDWMDSPHPTADCAQGCSFVSIRALTPDVEELGAIHSALGIDVDVVAGDSHGLEVVIDSPKGLVVLRTDEALG